MTRLLLVDNHDSFTWNLAHYLIESGATVDVRLADEIDPRRIDGEGFAGIVISPGPGRPEHAGASVEIVRRVAGRLPLLGVCLGHQAIAHAWGLPIVRAPSLVHGKTSEVVHDGSGLFGGMPSPLTATRYHSLAVPTPPPHSPLVTNARTTDGVVMGLRHRSLAVHGVQFHPESVLTRHGKRLVANFVHLVERSAAGERTAVRAPALLATDGRR